MLARFKAQFLPKLARRLNSFAHCDEDDASTPSLIELADDAERGPRQSFHSPMTWESFKNNMHSGSVSAFDGFRVNVQKTVNVNTMVNHFYWLGSQQMGGTQLYQYRICLADEMNQINVGTDMDFNIDGDLRSQLSGSTSAKASTTINENQKKVDLELTYKGETFTSSVQVGKSESTHLHVNYLQSVTKALVLGGQISYGIERKESKRSFAGIYDDGTQMVQGLFDKDFHLLYLRRVNPNRVNLSTELQLHDHYSKARMSLGAEYQLKQSKVHFSVDSDLVLKSVVEVTMSPGSQLQLSSEIHHATDTYRFGFGVNMMA